MTKFVSIGTSSLAIFAVSAVTASAVFAATTGTATSTPPSVVVFDQQIKSKTVDVSYAYLPTKGYVAVYGSDASGKPIRQALGMAEMVAGDHRNFKIQLNGEPTVGQKLWVSLYSDTDMKPGFDAKSDQSVWPDKVPSENAFVVR